MVENPLAILWNGRATIYEYKEFTDENFQTSHKLVAIVEDEPCRLSHNREQVTNIQNGAAKVYQGITLIIRPDLEIKSGSVISVTQNGVTEKYKGSGKPAVYSRHQEITLKLYEDNA